MISSAKRCNDADFCQRLEFLERSWERNALSPIQLLARGIEHGLTCDSDDPGQAAGDHTLTLAVSRPIDTPREDLLAIAEHTSALSDMITFILRTGDPWSSPGSIEIGQHTWIPESYIGPGGLRRVVLCDRWDENRAIAESFDWRTLEATLYDLPMTLIVVVLGASRDGRRHGPLSKGWLHPVAQDLRFRKRDGSGFDGNWQATFREQFHGDREEWFQSMTEDGVLEETLQVHQIPLSPRSSEIVELASRKLANLATAGLPDPQFSQCFDAIRQCPFRSCCPYFRMPSEANGFRKVSLSGSPPHF